MNVFISWSGAFSHDFAAALKDWLTTIFPSLQPFMSSGEIDKGSRWNAEIAAKLRDSEFGIISLTRDNLWAPWIMFESGALSKNLENARVVPVLLDLSNADFQREGGPLVQFQAVEFQPSDLFSLVKNIHESLPEQQRSLVQLQQLFDNQFPHLVAAFEKARQASTATAAEPARTVEQNVSEMLDIVVKQHKLLSDPTTILPESYLKSLLAKIEPAEGRSVDDSFLSRTEKHQNIVYSVRDICVKAMPNGIRYRPPKVRRKETAKPHAMLQRIEPDMVSLMVHVARMFDLLAPRNTRVWASLRDLRSDDQYHTFVRGGEYSPSRNASSSPLSETSKVVLRLKNSAELGTVVITGSSAGPEEWEPQRNDKFNEDLSVMMGLVGAKSFTKKGHWRTACWPWILAVNANRKGVFNEQHIPLMQCCVETFSLLANVLLRHPAGEESDE